MNIKNQLFLLAIIIAILSQLCNAIKYNISLAELEKCKVYYLDGTHDIFKESFEVNSVKNNLKKDNERLHLKFYLMASNTSNILLSNKNNTFCDRPCYEIILKNVKSWILTKYPVVYAKYKTSPNMLSTFDPMPVEIIQTNDGELIVNVPGYAEPLVKYLDTNPVDIKYFSFGSAYKTPAKWFYNCEFNENSNKEAQKMCDCGVKNVSSINSGAAAEIKQEDCLKKQTNFKEKNNEDQLLLLASKLSAIDSRITNLTDSFLSDCVETETNSKEKNNEEQLLTSKLSSTDPSMIKLMDSFLSRTIPLNRHNSFCNALVPTLNNFDDDQVIEFQQGVIEQMKKIKNRNTPTTTIEPIPEIDVLRGN